MANLKEEYEIDPNSSFNKLKKLQKTLKEDNAYKETFQRNKEGVIKRLEVQCIDGVKRIGHIRGKMKKRVWIANGDVVLVSLREFENDKCDVVAKYNEDEVRKLKKANEIPENVNLPEAESEKEKEKDSGYGDIVFEDEPEEDQKEKKKKEKKEEPEEDEEEQNIDDI